MRVCLIATEIFSNGFFGGFGALTKKIATGLTKKGIEVYVVTPRKKNQKPIEKIDDFIVVSYPSLLYTDIKGALRFNSIYSMIDADIYHSQEPSVGTCLALLGAPKKKHIITFQDPRNINDWRKQWDENNMRKIDQLNFIVSYYYKGVGRAVRRADAWFTQAKYIQNKAKQIFRLDSTPGFLPNPVDIPNRELKKSLKPTVCFLGRWDPIKRPELFFELSKLFPEVNFIAMGGSQPQHTNKELELKNKYSNVKNLKMAGWIFGDEKSKILEESWVLINTSTKECLPVSYLEACAHKCAILSHGNADNFASEFGFWAQDGDLDNFARGLRSLLNNNAWKNLGEEGFKYVKENHENDKVIEQHIRIYNDLLNET